MAASLAAPRQAGQVVGMVFARRPEHTLAPRSKTKPPAPAGRRAACAAARAACAMCFRRGGARLVAAGGSVVPRPVCAWRHRGARGTQGGGLVLASLGLSLRSARAALRARCEDGRRRGQRWPPVGHGPRGDFSGSVFPRHPRARHAYAAAAARGAAAPQVAGARVAAGTWPSCVRGRARRSNGEASAAAARGRAGLVLVIPACCNHV